MDVEEAERIVIAKPVASRPTCSTFKSFSELLTGAINVSPPNSCPETTVTAIRPKTVRIKPVVSCAPVSSQAEIPGGAVCYSSDSFLQSNCKSTAVYKPLAKLVSRTNVSFLENMGNSGISHQQAPAQVEACMEPPNRVNYHLRSDSSNFHQNFPSQWETEKIEPPKVAPENLEDEQKSSPPTTAGDRPSYDGYNWRKYGQKQVKGSEYPRSYYKCTHPNCPVKKKVERSLDGQIAEIVYRGEHNHSKPQPPKRNASGGQGQGLMSVATGQDSNYSLSNNHLIDRTESSECRTENQNEVGISAYSTKSRRTSLSYKPVTNGALSAVVATPDNSCGLSGDYEEKSKELRAEDDEPKSKRRKHENRSNDAGITGESVQDPHIVVQSSTDSEILGDGFRWRKYGQKVVKGNPYPRSYYRCTGLKCNVRKHVERASDAPGAFITTYEGKHNHDMPIKITNPVASEPEPKAASSKNKSGFLL